MDKNRIIEKLSWIFQSPISTPQPMRKEFKEEQYCFFENYVHFLQDNGFTTKEILKKGEKANEDSQIAVGDLTEEGLKFGIVNFIWFLNKIRDLNCYFSVI
jgi:hypothetical protein